MKFQLLKNDTYPKSTKGITWKFCCIYIKFDFFFLLVIQTCSWEIAMGDGSYDRTLREFCIPDYILLSGSEGKSVSHVPACPVIVFINSKSGGQLGGELLVSYSTLLNKNQVNCFFLFLSFFFVSIWVFFFKVGQPVWWKDNFISLMYQVFDLGKNAPDKVLQKLYATLETLKHNGDDFAAEIQNRLRIIVRWLL